MVEPLEFVFEGESAEAQKAFDRIADAEKKTAKETKGLSDKLRDFTVIATGVIRFAKSIGSGIASLGEKAARQEKAEIRLAVALAKTTTEVREQLDVLKGFATAKQGVTNFGDEFILEMATIGASFELTTEQIVQGVNAAVDQAEALGRSPVELMRMIGRFGAGLTDSLIEVGIAADTSIPRVEAFTKAMEQMTTGMAEAVGALPTSRFVQLSNTFGDLLEKLGSIIASTATFQSVLGFLKGLVSDIDAALGDPDRFAEVVHAIDAAVQETLQAIAIAAAFSLEVLGRIIRGIDKIIGAAARISDFPLFGGSGEIKKVERQLKKVSDRMLDIQSGGTEKFEGELGALADKAGFLRIQIDDLTGSIAGSDGISLEIALSNAAAALEEWADRENIFSESAQFAGDVIADLVERVRALAEANAEAAEGPPLLTDEQLERLFAINEILEQFGEGFTSSLGEFFQQAFDEDTGISEAWKNLGKNVKNEFIGQFTDAAFAPVKSQFGQLAVALRQPFEVVGNIISSILSPITGIITTVISSLVTQFFTLIGLQELLAGTGLAGVTAVAAGAAPVAAVWGAAATAASIATLGAALAFAAPAQAQIVAGASLAKALSIPGAAEGALALPTPGGHILNVAEAGKPELIVPLDDPRVGEALGGVGGGAVQVSFDGATLAVPDEETASFFAAELGAEFAEQLENARGESASEFVFGGVL